MTTDAAARAYLDYYLDRPGGPDAATMLEGPWGSGKSFFVDEYFRDRLAEARAKDPNAKEEIRVSLFGVCDLGEITSQIFTKAHPRLGGKAAKFVNVIASKAVSAFGVSADPDENARLLQETLLNLEGRVLVFDDFERCPMPLVEVMGYINRFVEQDRLKVVVVASEEDIDPDQIDEYRGRKEKLVGKTIRVGSDPGTVLDAFAVDLGSAEARAAVAANRVAVLSTFTARGRPNFRSLRAILADYDRLVSVANARLRASPGALGSLLLYIMAVGMEYRGNHIEADGLRTLSSDIAPKLNLGNAPISDERRRGADLKEHYPLVGWWDPVVPPAALAELFASGTIDVGALDAHLLAHPQVVGRAHVSEWRAMWNWYDMSATDYRTVRDAFADQLAAQSIVHPGELLHAAGTSIRLLGYGDDVLGGAKPKAFFKVYLADLESRDALEAVSGLFGIHSGSYAGLVYNEHDTPLFAEIHTMVRDATMRALSRRTAREAVELLDRLRKDPDDGAMLHEWDLEKGNYAGSAILHNIAVTDMADLLLVDDSFNDRLLRALHARYENAAGTPDLDPEKHWVRALRTELANRLKSVAAPFRIFGERRLAYWFEKMTIWAGPAKKPRTKRAALTGKSGSNGSSSLPKPAARRNLGNAS